MIIKRERAELVRQLPCKGRDFIQRCPDSLTEKAWGICQKVMELNARGNGHGFKYTPYDWKHLGESEVPPASQISTCKVYQFQKKAV
jgi:hypothetical protein